MEPTKIPITIGITGHRDLVPDEIDTLSQSLRMLFEELKSRCPHSPFRLISSLAEGADQLAVRIAAEYDIPFHAVLPFVPETYESDFSGEKKDEFRILLGQAASVMVAPCTEQAPDTESRDYFYRQAGIYVASHCHVLIALWDGGSGTPQGCGTAETVGFMLERNYHPFPDNAVRYEEGAVCHICCNRSGDQHTERVPEPGVTRFLGNEAAFRKILEETDAWNKESEQNAKATTAEDPMSATQIYMESDRRSVYYAARYKRILAVMALLSSLLTVSFLLYDEMNLHWMLLTVGVALLLLVLSNTISKRLRSQKRYIENRVLSESLRIGDLLRVSGEHPEMMNLLPWNGQRDHAWIREAVSSIWIGVQPHCDVSKRDAWIEGQRVYHEKAALRAERQAKKNRIITRTGLLLAVFSYLFAIFYEIYYAGLFTGVSRVMPEQAELFRTLLKLWLGSISSITFFASNYFGKLALERQSADHRRMEEFYREAARHLAAGANVAEYVPAIAREAMSENCGWSAYQAENTPEISIT